MPVPAGDGREQSLTALRARLAFLHEGRFADARALLERLGRTELRLPYQSRIRLEVLGHQLSVLGGEEDEWLTGLQLLAEQVQENSNMNLAAEIRRLAAECLMRARGKVRDDAGG
ncbi:hypothetical protein [Streptomyces finlayi]|uniref:hypothetical protein n=1 Tax=Streptomyces finlayi TaxID=67296 RepID=UPI0016292CFC|nr:hypothetical protein [Streptomyces finlayi]